jgi:type IV secretory pathway component VirB8
MGGGRLMAILSLPKSGSASIPEVKPEPKHANILKADPFAYKTAHRRMAWLLRLSVGTNVALAICVVATIQALVTLVPLKETEIALLRADPSDDRIYRVEPISTKVDGFELMLEKLARRYVHQILTIDDTTQNTRFKEVRTYSDPGFFNAYLKSNKTVIEEAIEDGLNRSITIKGAYQVDAYDGVYLYVVEFIQTDRIGREKPKRRHLRAFLEMTPRPHDVTAAERFENPLGIRILGMSIKEQASK